MTLNLDIDYEKHLQDAKPIVLGSITVHPPPGALGDITTTPPQVIPPLNTDIDNSSLAVFKLIEHPGLAALDHTKLPKNFNWRQNGDTKKRVLISTPGNQMLCGSCWAISTAGIIGDNHVVSGTVDWKPNLSTTWSLACYPQLKCKGGNPGKLFQSISQHGIATNHCVDYSWCAKNDVCNGQAKQHFKKGAELNLSAEVPNCGCYDSSEEHYLYFIDTPKSLSLGRGGMNEENFTNTVKKHIYHYGPVQGSFVVFANFMSGAFTKVNGGIYLEDAIYSKDGPHFQPGYSKDGSHFMGSHAIAIVGWGVEDNVVVDNQGTKKSIPYWYCRNSWKESWGDGGYFKMAMYPHNKTVQFDKVIMINTPKGKSLGGGMVLIEAKNPPKFAKLPQINKSFLEMERLQTEDYYAKEGKDKGRNISVTGVDLGKHLKNIGIYVLIFLGIILVVFLIVFFVRKIMSGRKQGRYGVYRFL